jgi:hypothetical protein
MAHLAGKQNLPGKSLLKAWVAGYVRKNDFERDMDAAQKAVLHLIDLTHPSFRNEANDSKSVDQYLAGSEPAGNAVSSPIIGLSHLLRRNGISRRFVHEVERPMLKKATGQGIFSEEFLDRSSEVRITRGYLIEEGSPLFPIECQCGLEQLLC